MDITVDNVHSNKADIGVDTTVDKGVDIVHTDIRDKRLEFRY